MKGTVIVIWPRSGSTRSSRNANFLIALKM